jgi:VanZ family protein
VAWLVVPATGYAVCLLLVVFWPVPVDRNAGADLLRALDWLHRHGVPEWFDYALVEWLANVAMFVPFGFLLAAVLRPAHWWLALLSAAAASACIEWAQGELLPERYASAADIAANTLGALVGIALCGVLLLAAAARSRFRHSRVRA